MLELTGSQILAHRRRASGLGARLDRSVPSVERAAAPGLQDSMPRAALLSIHARVAGTEPDVWERPPLVQVWGPRYNVFVVAARDHHVFTLGRLPDEPKARHRAEHIASLLEASLGDERMDVRSAARLVGLHPNALRYAAPTGRFQIYWDGARQPQIWCVGMPAVDAVDASRELLRRHLRFYGPSTPLSFGVWAGIRQPSARAIFAELRSETVEVRTPIGEGWILATDEPSFRATDEARSTRLLPSGDSYFLLHGSERALLVDHPGHREQLWTPRVWPGAVMVDGEIVGTWRRARHEVTISPWWRLTAREREAVEVEARSFPLSGISDPVTVTWADQPD